MKVPRRCVETGEWPEPEIKRLADFTALHVATCHYEEFLRVGERNVHQFFDAKPPTRYEVN